MESGENWLGIEKTEIARLIQMRLGATKANSEEFAEDFIRIHPSIRGHVWHWLNSGEIPIFSSQEYDIIKKCSDVLGYLSPIGIFLSLDTHKKDPVKAQEELDLIRRRGVCSWGKWGPPIK